MMNSIQAKLLEILQWYHTFCDDNNLRYIAVGGTFLGAVRHGGFIPWDDDIDVGMPRKDYEEFLKLMRNEQGRFRLETPYSSDPDYCYSVSKLFDSSTTAVEVSKYNCRRGLFVDIFPLDGIGNSQEEIDINFSQINKLNMLRASRMSEVNKARKWYKNLAIVVNKLIPEAVINTKKLIIKLDELCKEHDFDSYSYGGMLLTQYGKRYIMERSLFDELETYKFENTCIYGVKDYEKYLSQLYGDWRKLPPENKRESGHVFSYVNLNESYLEKESRNEEQHT